MATPPQDSTALNILSSSVAIITFSVSLDRDALSSVLFKTGTPPRLASSFPGNLVDA